MAFPLCPLPMTPFAGQALTFLQRLACLQQLPPQLYMHCPPACLLACLPVQHASPACACLHMPWKPHPCLSLVPHHLPAVCTPLQHSQPTHLVASMETNMVSQTTRMPLRQVASLLISSCLYVTVDFGGRTGTQAEL